MQLTYFPEKARKTQVVRSVDIINSINGRDRALYFAPLSYSFLAFDIYGNMMPSIAWHICFCSLSAEKKIRAKPMWNLSYSFELNTFLNFFIIRHVPLFLIEMQLKWIDQIWYTMSVDIWWDVKQPLFGDCLVTYRIPRTRILYSKTS